jgi:hypothetical protein
MSEFQTFIGGLFDTNAYVLKAPGGEILFDAPTGTLDWLEKTEHLSPPVIDHPRAH